MQSELLIYNTLISAHVYYTVGRILNNNICKRLSGVLLVVLVVLQEREVKTMKLARKQFTKSQREEAHMRKNNPKAGL